MPQSQRESRLRKMVDCSRILSRSEKEKRTLVSQSPSEDSPWRMILRIFTQIRYGMIKWFSLALLLVFWKNVRKIENYSEHGRHERNENSTLRCWWLSRKFATMTRKFDSENLNFLIIFLKFLFRKQQLAAKITKFLVVEFTFLTKHVKRAQAKDHYNLCDLCLYTIEKLCSHTKLI